MNDNNMPLRETIGAWLREQGHAAVVEAQDERYAEVLFRARGRRFAVRTDEHDPNFLFITLTMNFPDDIVDELLARRAAAQTESDTKVVKVDVRWESRTLVFSAEQFVTEPGGASIFWRTVSCLEGSLSKTRRNYEREAGRAAANRFTAQLEAELSDGGTQQSSSAPTEDAR